MPKYGVQMVDGGVATVKHDNLRAALADTQNDKFVRVTLVDANDESEGYIRRDRFAAFARIDDDA